jgi:hypothetical protein
MGVRMARLWKRLAGRHANAVSFWLVLAIVALALVFGAALVRGHFRL